MASTFYAKQSKADTGKFLVEFPRFLIDDLATFTGPGWTIIDTYSSGAGTPHEVPGDPTDMDSLAADNGWRSNSLVINDYIILESASDANRFQVGIEYQTNDTIRMIVAPTGGFVTGNDDNDMITASNWGNAIITHDDFDVSGVVAANWSIIADEDHFKLIYDYPTTPTRRFSYVGKLEDVHEDDVNPVFMWTVPEQPNAVENSVRGKTLSLRDGETEINQYMSDLAGSAWEMCGDGYDLDTVTGEYRLLPMYICANTSGDCGIRGRLIGTWKTDQAAGAVAGKGTFSTRSYGYVTNTSVSPPIVFEWDGSTVI